MITSKKIVLGSGSPRRKELLESLGLSLRIKTADIEEVYPETLKAHEVASYLAHLKAKSLLSKISADELLITSDTVVIQNNRVLGKPTNKKEAIKTLAALSGNQHEVVTGVFIGNNDKSQVFSETTKVIFRPLSTEEINYYISNYQPFDKAGSYGIQEWIGKIGVSKIEGCFYNVMGLPVGRVCDFLKQF